MNDTMSIESATIDDFPEIVDVWEQSVRATHDFLTEDDIQYFKPLILNEYLKAVELFVVREGDKLIGFLGLSPDKIEMLFLRPDARGKGIGKLLTRFAIHEKGITKVDVNEQNPQAVVFYQRMGFEVVSRSPLDPQGKPFPILSMNIKNQNHPMIIALVHYDAPLEDVDKFVAEHRAYLSKFYAERKVVFSGRQNPPNGGVIMFNLPSKDAALEIAKDDPFVVHKVAHYELIEFNPSLFDERFKIFLEQ